MMVADFGTPSASDASRSSPGTSRIISSLARTTIGIISTHRAIDAEKPLKAFGPTISVNSEKANRPATIEGMPVITSTRKVIVRAAGCFGSAYSMR